MNKNKYHPNQLIIPIYLLRISPYFVLFFIQKNKGKVNKSNFFFNFYFLQ